MAADFIGKPADDFDAKLGRLIEERRGIEGIDSMIDTLDTYIILLENRRDREAAAPIPTTRPPLSDAARS